MTPPTRDGDPRPAPAVLSSGCPAGLALLLALASCGPGRPGGSAPPALPPGVRAEVIERTYPVRGATHREIGRSLSENRVAIAGRRFAGAHSWRLTWRYRYGRDASACRIRSLDVRLVSETVLPRWEDRERADSVTAADWDRYVGLLRAHENGHRDIAYRAAREVHGTLRRVTSPDCALMPARADRLARDVVQKYKDRNRAYDEETGHGRTQGLRWPPDRDRAARTGPGGGTG